jgi:hypothetical protein
MRTTGGGRKDEDDRGRGKHRWAMAHVAVGYAARGRVQPGQSRGAPPSQRGRECRSARSNGHVGSAR